jgi:hypothetical protein
MSEFRWWIRTPGACSTCPWCGKQSYVMLQLEIDPKKCKVSKIIKKKVKDDDMADKGVERVEDKEEGEG